MSKSPRISELLNKNSLPRIIATNPIYIHLFKMNTENRYPIVASLYMLKEIKHRQERVNRGYQLLRRKVEALRFRGRQAAAELAATQGILGHTLREAYMSLAAVKFTNGESNAMVLENIGEAQVRVERIQENISGVTTISLQAIEDTGASDALRYAGLGAGGHRTGEAKGAFRQAIRILVKFASLRNTCILLDGAIRTNLRKVNGIEKVILPKLRNTETYIMMEMDEREREEFHRLKMVKAKKIRNQVLANVRQESVCDDGGETTDEGTTTVEMPPVRYADYLTGIFYAYSHGYSTKNAGDFYSASAEDDEDLLF